MLKHDSFKDKCGVVGVFGHKEASHLSYLALYGLQHRGQDSAGIVSFDGKSYHREVGMGLVADVFNDKNLRRLKGSQAIGHVRYTTAGGTSLTDAQPISVKTGNGQMSIAHNGNLVNAAFLRENLEKSGAIFQAQSDTEVICHLFAHSRCQDLVSCLRDSLEKVLGAYSLVLLVNGKMVGIRDPHGFRPLFLGQIDNAYVLASEDCCFSLIGAKRIREIEPGEMVVVDEKGLSSFELVDKGYKKPKPCIFEHIYFARPDSHIFGASVFLSRKNLGRLLARQAPVKADVVMAIPDSGVLAAMGYAEEAKIPYDIGLVRNHYVGRTFIEPEDKIRHFGVKLKLSPIEQVVKGKRLIVVDDSIVRGTTSKKIVELLFNAGAKEVHMRVSAPMTTHPCRYGIATPTKEELIASFMSLHQIKNFLKVNSLAYLSIESMHEAVGSKGKMCDACFSGEYPV